MNRQRRIAAMASIALGKPSELGRVPVENGLLVTSFCPKPRLIFTIVVGFTV